MSPAPANAVFDAFWTAFPTPEARGELAAMLNDDENHVVFRQLRTALLSNGPFMPLFLIDNGLMGCRWDDEAPALADRLAVSADPWHTLGAAIAHTIATRDAPPREDALVLPGQEADDELLDMICGDDRRVDGADSVVVTDNPIPRTVVQRMDGMVFASPRVANEIRHALRRAMTTGQWSAEAREFLRGCEYMGAKYEHRAVVEPVVNPKNPVAVSVVDGSPAPIVETVGTTEAANLVGISRQAIQKRIDTGKFTDAFMDGRRWRVSAAEAKAMRAEHFTTVVNTLRKGEARYLEALALLDGLREDEPAIAHILGSHLAEKLAVVRIVIAEATRRVADEGDVATVRAAVEAI